jgi:hypothetical protein
MSTAVAAEVKKAPSVFFKPEVWDKIMYWVRKTKLECSGFGILKQRKDGSFEVIDAMMLPQKNSTGDTEIDGAGLAKAMFHYKDTEGYMNFWWHSHHSMGVFWSQTDRAAIDLISGQGWCLATVFNHKGEWRSALQYQVKQEDPWGGITQEKVFHDNIDTYRYDVAYPKEVIDAWDAEFAKNDAPKLVEKYRSLYLSGGGVSRNPVKPNGISQEEFGAWQDKFGESSYGEPGKPGYCGQFGFVNEHGTFSRYQNKKHRKNIFKAAAKLAGKTGNVSNIEDKEDDDQTEIDFTQAPSYGKTLERLNLPEHLSEYRGVENIPFNRVPTGHTRGSYLAHLDRYRYILEIDETKLIKLISEKTPPRYDGFEISDMKELICCQEDILEGGDAHSKFEVGIETIEQQDARLIAEYEGMYGRVRQ